MKVLRALTTFAGLLILLVGLGFAFGVPLATRLWPWPDGRLSYLFVGSIMAAISAAAVWIGWSGEFAALAAGSLNVLITAAGSSLYFFSEAARGGRANLLPFGIGALLMAIAAAAAHLWSRRLPLSDERPMPRPVAISFWVFAASLVVVGAALVLRMPVFPWDLNPDSSVIFGLIFLGDASYFAWALFRPKWHNALGQLLSFLAYDLVLIVPFLLLFGTVQARFLPSLIPYVVVLLYSAGLAIYFLFVHRQTRLGAG